MCIVKTKVIPVIMETNYNHLNSFKKYLNNVQGKHEIK